MLLEYIILEKTRVVDMQDEFLVYTVFDFMTGKLYNKEKRWGRNSYEEAHYCDHV